MIQCPECEGKDATCPHCHGHGRVDIDCCGKRLPGEVYAALEASDFARKGLFPVSGGYLDQTLAWRDAVRFVWSDESPWRAKLRLRDSDG